MVLNLKFQLNQLRLNNRDENDNKLNNNVYECNVLYTNVELKSNRMTKFCNIV